MRLTAPSFSIFSVSMLLAIGVVALKYFSLSIPVIGPMVGSSMFEMLLVAYILLAAGALFRGI